MVSESESMSGVRTPLRCRVVIISKTRDPHPFEPKEKDGLLETPSKA